MTVEAEHQERVEAIEKHAGEAADPSLVEDTSDYEEHDEPAEVSIKGAAKRNGDRFPGTGRTLSGEVAEEADPEDDDEAEIESDFGDEYESGIDDEDEIEEEDEEDYASDADKPRGGSATYNLRAANSKRRLSEVDDDEDEEGPSTRTRQRTS
ncbi:hypothetical protein EC988_004780, partial [Linderina pennispora]